MFSVTNRIKIIRQPNGGYISPHELKETEYFDKQKINKVASLYKSIQGTAVDSLTRFMNGVPRHIAFKISLVGAELIDELENACHLLSGINGLDDDSIYKACQLVGYDVVYRRGEDYYISVDRIHPNKQLRQNIAILVNRSLAFFKHVGPVVSSGFTFEGGYNDIISSGDGDYLTKDTLWDLKVSERKPTINHTLQLLVYYILGIHSIHPEFQTIKRLGIFNPELNTAYTIDFSNISDKVFYDVSKNVIGYCMPDDIEQWRKATGTSEETWNEIRIYCSKMFKDTGFSPDRYEDGIHDITVDDYWSYYKTIANGYRPNFTRTQSVKFIKNSGFFMFVSVSKKGSFCILQGAYLRKLKQPLQYYYDRLPEYANRVLSMFSRYWDALYSISKQVQSIVPDEKEIRKHYKEYVDYNKEQGDFCFQYELWRLLNKDRFSLSGKVHGCIVDIDYFNHIYLNPYDGSIVPYFAPSMYEKYVYKNVSCLISEKRPEMLPAFNRVFSKNADKKTTALLLADSKDTRPLSVLEQSEIGIYNVLVTDTDMYELSNRMKQLQTIYDHHLVCVWYDNILPYYELEKERKLLPGLTIGETKTMKCGMSAAVLADNGYDKVTIQFEDGTIVKNCRRSNFRAGRIGNPSIRRAGERISKTYIGKSAVMNCGLRATIIEDFGYNNITIQFEDGLVKKNCRRDKFREGKIGHKV